MFFLSPVEPYHSSTSASLWLCGHAIQAFSSREHESNSFTHNSRLYYLVTQISRTDVLIVAGWWCGDTRHRSTHLPDFRHFAAERLLGRLVLAAALTSDCVPQ